MTNHAPIITSSSVSDSFSEFLNTTDSTVLHQLSGTMNFTDSDHSDTHTTNANLDSAVLSSGSIIPAASLTSFDTAMTSQILSDHNGSGQLKWSFSDADDEFDFLAKDQTLTLTYDIVVSDNHGGTAMQTVKVTVTGTDDKPVINVTPVATVTEQADQTLSFSPDTAHVAINFTDDDLTNTGYTASVIAASASGDTSGILPGFLGNAELMSFLNVDNVVKPSGSSTGTINTTFSAPDLAFDYLAAGEQLNINYTVQLDDHAGGITTQNVMVTVIGTNDKPVFLSGPETAHLAEDKDVSPAGNLTAHGDLFFSDIDLSDTHTVSTTVTASLSSGHAIPLSNAAAARRVHAHARGLHRTRPRRGRLELRAAEQSDELHRRRRDADAHLPGRRHRSIERHRHPGRHDHDPRRQPSRRDHQRPGIGFGGRACGHHRLTGRRHHADGAGRNAEFHRCGYQRHPHGRGFARLRNLVGRREHPGGDAGRSCGGADHHAARFHGTGSGSIDWNFGLADQDFDFLAADETLTVNYNVAVSDAATTAMQTVTVTVTGANDVPVITSGPETGTVAELADTTRIVDARHHDRHAGFHRCRPQRRSCRQCRAFLSRLVRSVHLYHPRQ